MTKYVLNSGGVRNNPELAKKFFAELIDGLTAAPHILLCFFAQPREDWEKKFTEYTSSFKTFSPDGVTATFELAFPALFEEQVKKTDIVYMSGGDDHLLQYWLKQFNLPAIWNGKVVATNSASSHALSKHYWTCDWRQTSDGLGIVPIRFLAHYQSSYGADDPRGPIDWEAAKQVLEAYGDTALPVYALKEGEYIVVKQ
jgi:hypothetical protein